MSKLWVLGLAAIAVAISCFGIAAAATTQSSFGEDSFKAFADRVKTAQTGDASAYPFLFLFAIANSLLAARSGGLLAPIAMHAVNNMFAVLAILELTRALR